MPEIGGENIKKNKRPMVHIAHLRDQFKSMKTFEQSYDYMYIYY